MALSACGGQGDPASSSQSINPGTQTITPTRPLNDTGITACGRTRWDSIACPDPDYPGQDGEFGRDVQYNDNKDGVSGFSFTKLDAEGKSLDASAENWSCVKDNVTGLVWEAKTNDGGLRDESNTFTWYDKDATDGALGLQNGGVCSGEILCDTSSYVQAINDIKFCGSDKWHVPNVNDLLSIGNYWKNPGPPGVTEYFPEQMQHLWAAETHPFSGAMAWTVYFTWGSSAASWEKNKALPLRLVSNNDAKQVSPGPTFVNNDDGTVIDTTTGLMWMRCAYGLQWNGSTCLSDHLGGYNWKTALLGVQDLNGKGGFAGHVDWRIPNIKELASIVEWGSQSYFNPVIFPAIPPYVSICSSSPDAYTLSGVWVIETSNAEIRSVSRDNWSSVSLFVRGGL